MKSHFVGCEKRPIVSYSYQIKPGLGLKHVIHLMSSVYCAALLKGVIEDSSLILVTCHPCSQYRQVTNYFDYTDNMI